MYLHLQTLGIVSITCNHLYLATNGELARILKQVDQHLLEPHLISKQLLWELASVLIALVDGQAGILDDGHLKCGHQSHTQI